MHAMTKPTPAAPITTIKLPRCPECGREHTMPAAELAAPVYAGCQWWGHLAACPVTKEHVIVKLEPSHA